MLAGGFAGGFAGDSPAIGPEPWCMHDPLLVSGAKGLEKRGGHVFYIPSTLPTSSRTKLAHLRRHENSQHMSQPLTYTHPITIGFLATFLGVLSAVPLPHSPQPSRGAASSALQTRSQGTTSSQRPLWSLPP